MRELWTRDREAIRHELELAAGRRLPAVLLDGRGQRVLACRFVRLLWHAGQGFVVIRRMPGFAHADPQEAVWLAYRFANRPVVLCRAVAPRAARDLLAFPLPSQLYFMQRRRHRRYFIRHQGVVSFFVANRARVCQMRLADISLEGACLVGLPRYDLGPADRLGPATFSVVTEGEPIVKEVTISHAAVVRHRPRSASELELGIRFVLDQAERLAVTRLLTDPFGGRLFSLHPPSRPQPAAPVASATPASTTPASVTPAGTDRAVR